MPRLDRVALLVGVTLLSGCAAPLNAFERGLEDAGLATFTATEGRTVTVRVGALSGRGAVVGPNEVLTVAHVVRGQRQVWVATGRRGSGWVLARVVRRVPSWPEPLVVLALPVDSGLYGSLLGFPGFSTPDRFQLAPAGATAAAVVTRRGRRAWLAARLRRGDSGSPVVDERGALIGLVSGRIGGHPVFAALPTSPGETLLARR